MSITPDTVMKIAGIAKIGITSGEAEQFAQEMRTVAAFADRLASLDAVPTQPDNGPAAIPASPAGGLREDVREVSPPRDALLRNAPERDESSFLVPKVMEQ